MDELYDIKINAAQKYGTRSELQDCVGATSPDQETLSRIGAYAVLADGMGGLKDGAAVAKIAVDVMIETCESAPYEVEPTTVLLEGCRRAQDAIRAHQTEPAESGTTLVAAFVRRNRFGFISVGDSRIYLFRGGALIQLNREQTRAMMIDERVALGYYPEEARTDAHRKALLSYLGSDELILPDRSPFTMQIGPGDGILLASDGVFQALDESELEEILGEYAPDAAERIVGSVIAKNLPDQDNCSAIVMYCGLDANDRQTMRGGDL